MKRSDPTIFGDGRMTELFSLFGVQVAITCKDVELRARLMTALREFFPMPLRAVRKVANPAEFVVQPTRSGYDLTSPFGAAKYQTEEPEFIRALRNLVRVIVASNARRHLFIHAGVVGIGTQALIIPGDSHSGKTSLVKALVQQGATYYSDEYAVIDSAGMLLPFPKSLSVRGIESPEVQTEVAVASLGGEVGKAKLSVGWVLFTQYVPRARWDPLELGPGEGRLLLIPHMIGLYRRPKFSLRMVEKALFKAKILKSDRGEAASVARKILDTLDK